MSNGLAALKAWVYRNRAQWEYGRYTVDDIARLAIACGFHREAVAQWQATQTFKETV